jgi:hypothetical protein
VVDGHDDPYAAAEKLLSKEPTTRQPDN